MHVSRCLVKAATSFTTTIIVWNYHYSSLLQPLVAAFSLTKLPFVVQQRNFKSINRKFVHEHQRTYNTLSPSLVLQMKKTDTTTDMSSGATTTTSSSRTVIEGPVIPTLEPSSKRIFWIRHGEVINPGGTRTVYYGAQDVLLSNLGKLEAQAAGQYLQQFTLHNVYSSTLSRAIYGATKIIEYQQSAAAESEEPHRTLQLVQLPGFLELDRGEWAGKTIDEIGRDVMKQFDNCDESVTPIGGESYPTLKRRVLQAKDTVLDQMGPGTCAAVVSHLQVTRCIVSDALQIPTSEMVANVAIATASVTCIDYNNDGTCTVHYQSFKPADAIGLQKAKDGAN